MPAGSASADLPDGADAVLAPLVADPSRTAVLCDFDGTLAPIVLDPADARPLEPVPVLLRSLARRFAVVAIVSGRPAAFLADHLGPPAGAAATVGLHGIYGMESVDAGGAVRPDARVAPWLPVAEEVAARLRHGLPEEVMVELKGPAVTVHWRRAPDEGARAAALVAEETARTGLEAHPGRMSCELRPPLAIDKGTVVEELSAGCTAACFLGDDVGDLPAFAALGRLATGGTATVGIAVRDAETAPEVAAAADLVVEGPEGAVAVLAWLDRAAGDGPA